MTTTASAQTLDKLSFEAATKIAAAAARARGVGVVMAVVDDAAIYRRPGSEFEEQIKAGRVATLALADSTRFKAAFRSGSTGR